MASMFAPKPGCPLCSVVASALSTPSDSWSTSSPSNSTKPEILWRDENFTAYRERSSPVSSRGHVIIAFNLHVPSLYTLSSNDLPLLVNLRNLAPKLLTALDASSAPSSQTPTPTSQSFPSPSAPLERSSRFRIGFITPPFRDNKIPVTDHLHCHAYIEPSDLLGWFRGLAYGPLAWYAIDDLIAEIRESVSNNRVKSGYGSRPIDKVPQAGARSGTANGVETTEPGLAQSEHDLEQGDTPRSSSPMLAQPHPLRT